MNEVMIMRRGGGTKLFAAIGATYPEGYSCTCTGKNSGKVLTAKKSPWIFAIPEVGEWTVAVNGGSNPSQTVKITTEGQVEKVNLGFSLVLFDGGDNTEVSGGWDYDETKQGPGAATENTTFSVGETLYYSAGKDYDENGIYAVPRMGFVYHQKAVDLSKYTTITVESNVAGAEVAVYKSLSDEEPEKYETLGAGTTTLSVSNINGSRYICFYNNAIGSSAAVIDVSSIVIS